MEVVNGLGSLIDDIPFMLVSQHILANESVEVDIHELEQDVDIPLVVGTDHLFQLHNVRVLELLQKHYLSVGSLGICGVLKCIKVFFESEGTMTTSLGHFPDDPVGPAAYFLDYFEALCDVAFYFLVI